MVKFTRDWLLTHFERVEVDKSITIISMLGSFITKTLNKVKNLDILVSNNCLFCVNHTM